jgi:integrase/recombinase XerD
LQAYGAWLKWLSDELPDEFALGPLERTTRDNVRLYMESLTFRGLAPSTVQLHLQRLGQMMVAVTESKDFRWLFKAANRIKTTSVRNKRARVVPSYELAELGFRLMRKAEDMPASWHEPPATKFRNGLMIAFLAYRPVRLANLAGMEIGKHIKQCGSRYLARFDDNETKQREVVEFPVPSSLTKWFDLYLTRYRPQLDRSGAAGDSLWVSRDSGPLTAAGAHFVIVRETKIAFGHSVNPHMFRDCAATTVAIDDPEHAFAIAAILGHSSMITSEKYYNQARMLEAGTAYHQVLENARR